MKKKIVLSIIMLMLVVGCVFSMGNKSKANDVSKDSDTSKVTEISKRQSTVVGKLDIVKMYMEDKYSASEEKFVEGQEERTIRIWMPESYDANDTNKRYPVMYMHDGQNLFDDATSYCGEWGIDETITDMMKYKGYGGAIVVGIDCSDYRQPEMKPTWDDNYGLADRYSDFIINTVKKYVDSNYNTLTDRANTGIGGSSMGGLISYYMGMKHPELFGYEVCFAPAFCFVTNEQIKDYMERHDIANKENPKIYMFCGGQDLDAELYGFIEPVKNVMFENGYDRNLIQSNIDMSQSHTEAAWRWYFPRAYSWLV